MLTHKGLRVQQRMLLLCDQWLLGRGMRLLPCNSVQLHYLEALLGLKCHDLRLHGASPGLRHRIRRMQYCDHMQPTCSCGDQAHA